MQILPKYLHVNLLIWKKTVNQFFGKDLFKKHLLNMCVQFIKFFAQ